MLVWIPGGGYVIGMSSLPEFDGGRLAAGGVVVVTLNYRLGVEGFAQIDGAPANRGLLDQVAALQWVRDNIRAFGGDPDRVTVFGQSAGGGSVAALLAMPRAAGLFRRAVAQSVPGTFFSPELAADIAAACAAELGARPTAADLSAVDPSRLPAAGDAVAAKIDRWKDRWGPITHRPIPFAPVVDGDVLPATPWQALADGAGRDVDLLVGHVRDEHRLFSLIDGVLGQVTEEQAETALRTLAPGPDGARRYREAFPAAGPEELYELVNADWLFRMPTLHLAQAHAASGGRTHLYELTWPAPGLGGALGACHGLDVPLVFGNLSSGQPALLIGETPSAAGGGAVRTDPRRVDGVRRRRRPRLARVRRRAAARPAPRHPTGRHRLPGGGLPAAVAAAHLPGPPADRPVAAWLAVACWSPDSSVAQGAGCSAALARSTRAFRPMAVAPMTAAAATAASRLTCSPSSSADQPSVSAGWASCSRPTRATPPRARPAYQAKKPRPIETRLT